MRHARLCLILALGLLPAACATAPHRPDGGVTAGDASYLKAKVAWMAQRQIDGGVAGISIAVVNREGVVWEAGFGHADRERGVAAGPETLYRVGSISKLFTATAVMQLAEEGRVDIDAPLSRALKGFSIRPPLRGVQGWSPDSVRVRDVMTHHSGLPGDVFHRMFSKEPYHYTDYVGLVRDMHAAGPPRRVHAYSNLGFTLLGHMVEQVSGERFAEYVRDHIFIPAGMETASFERTDAVDELLSQGYEEGKEEAAELLPIGMAPAGSLYASVRDLGEWARTVLNGGVANGGRVLKKETLRSMWQRQNGDVPLDLDLEMGLGWFLDEQGGVGRVVGHGGGTMYFFSSLVVSPEQGLAAVALTNTQGGDPGRLAREALKLAVEAQTGVAPPKDDAPEIEPEASFSRAELSGWAGPWQTIAGVATVAPRGPELQVAVAGTDMRLVPTDERRFSPCIELLGIPLSFGGLRQVGMTFERVAGHEVVVLHRHGRRTLIGSRYVPRTPAGRWRQALGEWRPPEGDSFVESMKLVDHHGALALEMRLTIVGVPLVLALDPVDARHAVVAGLGRNRGDVVELAEDGTLRVLGYALTRAPEDDSGGAAAP